MIDRKIPIPEDPPQPSSSQPSAVPQSEPADGRERTQDRRRRGRRARDQGDQDASHDALLSTDEHRSTNEPLLPSTSPTQRAPRRAPASAVSSSSGSQAGRETREHASRQSSAQRNEDSAEEDLDAGNDAYISDGSSFLEARDDIEIGGSRTGPSSSVGSRTRSTRSFRATPSQTPTQYTNIVNPQPSYETDDLLNLEPPPAYEPPESSDSNTRTRSSNRSGRGGAYEEVNHDEEEEEEIGRADEEAEEQRRSIRGRGRRRDPNCRSRRKHRIIKSAICLSILVLLSLLAFGTFWHSRTPKSDGRKRDSPHQGRFDFTPPPNSTRIRWSTPVRRIDSDLPPRIWPRFEIYESTADVRIPFPHFVDERFPTPDWALGNGHVETSARAPWTSSMDDVLFGQCSGGGYFCKIRFVDEHATDSDNALTGTNPADEYSILVKLFAQYSSIEARDRAEVWAVRGTTTSPHHDGEDSTSSATSRITSTTSSSTSSRSSPSHPPQPSSPLPSWPTYQIEGSVNYYQTPFQNSRAAASPAPTHRGILIATDPRLRMNVSTELLAFGIEFHLPRRRALGTLQAVTHAEDNIVEWNANVSKEQIKAIKFNGNETRISFQSPLSVLESISAYVHTGMIEVNKVWLEAPRLVFKAATGKIKCTSLRSNGSIHMSVLSGTILADAQAPNVTLQADVGLLGGAYNISSSFSFHSLAGEVAASVRAMPSPEKKSIEARISPPSWTGPLPPSAPGWDNPANEDMQEVTDVTVRGTSDDGTVEVYLAQDPHTRLNSKISTINGNILGVHNSSFEGKFELQTGNGEFVEALGPNPLELLRSRRHWSEDLRLNWFRTAVSRGRTWRKLPGRTDPPGTTQPTWRTYGASVFQSQRGQIHTLFE